MSSTEKFLSIKTAAQQLHINPKAWRLAAVKLLNPAHRAWLIIPLAFLVNLLLVAPLLMPLFTEINPDDEAKYIQSGWLLLQGELRDLSWGPLVALVYAPVHLIAGGSPDWFMLEAWIGRFLLYACLWGSMIYLARQMKAQFSPYVLAGILFVTMPLFQILENQSDALFVSFSVLALAQVIAYERTRRLKNVWLASLFVGLGALARVDSLPLAGLLLGLALSLGWRSNSMIKILAASLVPTAAVLATFVLLSLLLQGTPNLGLSGKSWDSFEMNQPVPEGSALGPRQETQRLFGTEEENQGSVLRAVLRNPAAFANRLLANALAVPSSYLDFFTKTQGPLLIFCAAWGVYFLIKKKQIPLLIILLLWPLHTAVNLAFFTRHIIPQSYYLPMILGAVGIWGLCDPDTRPAERLTIAGSVLATFMASWLGGKPAFLPGALLLATILGIAWLVKPLFNSGQERRLVALLLLLAGGLILRAPYPFPNFPVLGQTENEQAVHYLEEQFQPQTLILSDTARPAIASRMNNLFIDNIPAGISSSEELWTWMLGRGIRAVYVDSRSSDRADITAQISKDAGKYYDAGFISDQGNVQVFLVRVSPVE